MPNAVQCAVVWLCVICFSILIFFHGVSFTAGVSFVTRYVTRRYDTGKLFDLLLDTTGDCCKNR